MLPCVSVLFLLMMPLPVEVGWQGILQTASRRIWETSSPCAIVATCATTSFLLVGL
jgi:hypothetical protein